ncbi:MAG: cysteine desulfurase [Kofleriaceae bacterium]|nr:cysteine desulfurase [Kofleriaceae bacterium]
MTERIYLDHNATAPLLPEARAAVLEALAAAGNPSSIHAEGRGARDRIEAARGEVARLCGGAADEIILTSGGTEADSLGVVGLALGARRAGRPARVLATAIEHPAVTGAVATLVGLGFTAEDVRVDGDGRIDLDDLRARCGDGVALVTVAAANHELGTLQDVAAVAAIARAAGAAVHVDAVQLAGKQPLAPVCAVADAVALSAHKLGGPAGAGALWSRRGVELTPAGGSTGHQERGRRPGTENLVGIVGLGAAAAVATASPARWAAATAAAAQLEAGLRDLGARIHGAGAPRVGNTVNAAFDGVRGHDVVIALDLAGVACATGAACSSGSVQPSPVLLALGLAPARAREAIRFSTGPATKAAEIARVLALLPPILARARGGGRR